MSFDNRENKQVNYSVQQLNKAQKKLSTCQKQN